jgi:hypothetical protein
MASNVKTLKGSALWAKVFEGQQEKFDNNSRKFVKAPDGDFSISLVVSEIEAAEMCEYLEGVGDEQFQAQVKRDPKMKNTLSTRHSFDTEYDENGDPTGNLVFKFKAKARTKDGMNRKIMVVDAKRKPMNDLGIEIGNGSQVKVAFNPIANYVAAQKTIYVTLYLSAIQVIELNEYSPSNSPFDEEDGYIAKAVEKDDSQEVPFEEESADVAVEGDF